MNTSLDLIERALRSTKAGIWDKHYGNGVSAEYARAVDSEITDALNVLPAVREEMAKMADALKPFAALKAEVDRLRHSDDSTCGWRIKAGDIRRAAEALEAK
jgi:hypothetical protein